LQEEVNLWYPFGQGDSPEEKSLLIWL